MKPTTFSVHFRICNKKWENCQFWLERICFGSKKTKHLSTIAKYQSILGIYNFGSLTNVQLEFHVKSAKSQLKSRLNYYYTTTVLLNRAVEGFHHDNLRKSQSSLLGSYQVYEFVIWICKVEKVLKDSLNSISSPSVKIQIIGGRVYLRKLGKTLLGDGNKLFVFKSLVCWQCPAMFCLYTSSKLYHLEFEFSLGDGIISRLSS